MRRWTLAEIKAKINRDLDLESEDFVTADELLDLINEGIDECESQIHLLGRENEYFMRDGSIALVQNQSDYDLPTDIYANKLLGVTFVRGSTIYPVKRLRNLDRFQDIEVINQYSGTDGYSYLLVHQDAATGYKMRLFPKARETGTNIKIWYIRNANRLLVDADVCDLPEFVYYVIAFVKEKILFKEGHPNHTEAKAELEKQKSLMLETLGEMVPDNDTELTKDTTHYEESI